MLEPPTTNYPIKSQLIKSHLGLNFHKCFVETRCSRHERSIRHRGNGEKRLDSITGNRNKPHRDALTKGGDFVLHRGRTLRKTVLKPACRTPEDIMPALLSWSSLRIIPLSRWICSPRTRSAIIVKTHRAPEKVRTRIRHDENKPRKENGRRSDAHEA